MALPENTTTIEELVRCSSSISLSYGKFSFFEELRTNDLVPIWNVINDYIDELMSVTVKVKLTDEEYRKYMYKPKLLSYDMYGNTELYFIILIINNIADIKEFGRQSFRMISKKNLFELLSEIYNTESTCIADYNSKYSGIAEYV